MKHSTLFISIASLVIIFLLDIFAPDASILPALLFWAAAAQGLIALVVAADLSNAGWITPIRDRLLLVQPLLLLPVFGFLFFAINHLQVYPWHGGDHAWLSPGFFIARNIALLLLMYVFSLLYLRALRSSDPRKGLYGVLYILFFVAGQSLMGIDWVMSFEAPWISTLFGAYFFIEAFYVGIGLMAVITALLYRQSATDYRKPLRDSGNLILGFALLWAGQLFAQYLTIWYGNLPEEVSYVYKRFMFSPYEELSYLVVICLFLLPFVIMFSSKVKQMPKVIMGIAGLIFIGYYVEKLVFLLPDTHLSPVFVVLQTLVFGVPFAAVIATAIRPSPATA